MSISTHLESLNFDFYESMHFMKVENYQINKIHTPLKMENTAVLELLDCPKLISRKIRMTEKSWNFHTVNITFVRKRKMLHRCDPNSKSFNVVFLGFEIERFLKRWIITFFGGLRLFPFDFLCNRRRRREITWNLSERWNFFLMKIN